MQKPIQYNQFPNQSASNSHRPVVNGSYSPSAPRPAVPIHVRRPSASDLPHHQRNRPVSPSRLTKRTGVVLLSPLPIPQPAAIVVHHRRRRKVLKRTSFEDHLPLRIPTERAPRQQRSPSPIPPALERTKSPRPVIGVSSAPAPSLNPHSIPQVVNVESRQIKSNAPHVHKDPHATIPPGKPSSTQTDPGPGGGGYYAGSGGFSASYSSSALPGHVHSSGPLGSRQLIKKKPDKFKPLPKVGGKTNVGRSVVRLNNEVTVIYGRGDAGKEGLAISPSQMS